MNASSIRTLIAYRLGIVPTEVLFDESAKLLRIDVPRKRAGDATKDELEGRLDGYLPAYVKVEIRLH